LLSSGAVIPVHLQPIQSFAANLDPQVAVSAKHGVLLMNYKAVRHNFFELPSAVGGRLAGFDITTGKRLWDQDGKYQTRPLINDSTIYSQVGAWDLKTGSPVEFELNRSYGCGQIAASKM
jgi:hypothetical protein